MVLDHQNARLPARDRGLDIRYVAVE
jgi:hypothetical protein